MRLCPFCKHDLGDLTLKDGRCPQCGGIVQWEAPDIVDSLPNLAPAPAPTKAEENSKRVEQIWRQSIVSDSNLGLTIKSQQAEITVSDSVFSIQTRDIRPANDEAGLAALDYELIDIIGQGGVGVVYAARQASIDRRVAIKMLRDEYRGRVEHRDKFLAEAVLTGELDHPNIVPIYDLGRNDQGELFYAMKNVVGTPWDQVIESNTIAENIDILLKVADAIAFAHSRGVIHRDLKPENVMIGNYGEVLVMDWGIALPTEGFSKSASILRSQAMGGTPAYMAPELAAGPATRIGKQSDVYLLGAILFEILTGTPPHHGVDVMDCVKNAANNVIVSTTVTGELMDIALKAMATIPGRRFHSVLAFQSAIREYESHRDSLNLSDKAEVELKEANQSQDYSRFSKSLFGFQEALVLWNANEAAKDGERRARQYYAQVALDKGDFDLGLSLLENQGESFEGLRARARELIQERDQRQSRLKAIKRLAAMLALFIFLAGSIAIGSITLLYTQSRRLNSELSLSKQSLDRKVEEVEEALENAQTQQKIAFQERTNALQKKREAEESRSFAEISRLETVAEKRRAEESSYFAEIGLVDASLKQNNFGTASSILERLQKSPTKSKLRHWEWGRFQFLVQGGGTEGQSASAVQITSEDNAVVAMDVASTQGWIAVGLANGEIRLYTKDKKELIGKATHGRTISDLDLSPFGDTMATVGLDAQGQSTIQMWSISDRGALKSETIIRSEGSEVLAVCISRDSRWIATGGTNRIARVWDWRNAKIQASLLGHLDDVTDIQFLANAQGVLTASLDGSVRLWNPNDGVEIKRFHVDNAAVKKVAISPDGSTIGSAISDGRIILWNNDSQQNSDYLDLLKRRVKNEEMPQQPRVEIKGHESAVNDLAFSPDGNDLVSVSNDNTAIVWAMPNRRPSKSSEQAKQPLVSEEGLRQRVRLRGHGGWVRCVCFSADGQQVLSGSDDQTWREWRFGDYREVSLMGDNVSTIEHMDLGSDGRFLATAHDDGALQIWDLQSQTRKVRLFEGHEYLTNMTRLTKDGRKLITAGGDNSLRLWDFQKGTELAVVQGSGRNARFSLSPNEQWLITTGDERGVQLIHLETMQASFLSSSPLVENDSARRKFVEPTCAAVTSDGKLAIVGTPEGKVEFWDVTSKAVIATLPAHTESIIGVFVTPGSDGIEEECVTVSGDGTVAWWDLLRHKESNRKRIQHFAPLQSASISRDGLSLATFGVLGKDKSKVWMWDLTSSQLKNSLEIQRKLVQDIAIDPFMPSECLATLSDATNAQTEIVRWNTISNEVQPLRNLRSLPSSTWGAKVVGSRQQVLTYGGRGAILWDSDTGRAIQAYRPSSSLSACRFAWKGGYVATGSVDGHVTLWDIAKGVAVQKHVVPSHAKIVGLAFVEHDQKLLAVDREGGLARWDIATGQLESQTGLTEFRVQSIALRPFQDLLAVASEDGKVRLLSVATFETKNEWQAHPLGITSLAFSPNGEILATGSKDKTIRLWRSEDHRLEQQLLGHSAAVVSLDFSADAARLLTASSDTTVRLWDIGREIGPQVESSSIDNAIDSRLGELVSLDFHKNEVAAARFSKDGRDICSAGKDGTIVLWPSISMNPTIHTVRTVLTMEPGQALPIDPSMRAVVPTHSSLFQSRLHVEIPQSNMISDRIRLADGNGMLKVEGNRVSYAALPNEYVAFARIQRPSNQILEVEFEDNATAAMATCLLQSIVYEVENATSEAIQDRTLVLDLQTPGADVVTRSSDSILVRIKSEEPSVNTATSVSEGIRQ